MNILNAKCLIAFSMAMSLVSVVGAQPRATVPGQNGYMGLVVEARQAAGGGLKIVEMDAGGTAAFAGLKVGDRMIAIDDRPVSRPSDLARSLSGTQAGSQLRVHFSRAGVEGQVRVVLGAQQADGQQPSNQQPGARPTLPPPPDLPANVPPRKVAPADARADGLLLGVLSRIPTEQDLIRLRVPAQYSRGALVKEVYAGSAASRARLPIDSLVIDIDGLSVESPTDLRRHVKQAGQGKKIELTYVEGGRTRKIGLTLGSAPRKAGKMPLPPPPLPEASGPARRNFNSNESRLDALEKRMTTVEHRLIDIQQTLDRAFPPEANPPFPRDLRKSNGSK